MFVYLLRRVLALIPTLFGITLICFLIINLAPGGPIEQKIQQIRRASMESGGGSESNLGVSEEVIADLKKQYGFDKPMHTRYWIWLKNLSKLDFGMSHSEEEPAIDVIVSKFPVSLQFGIISFILTYLVCIPLGIMKAVKEGSKFDLASSFVLIVMYSIPPLMLAILLITFFAGGSFYDWFPLTDIISDNYDELTFMGKVWDRIHHFILPLLCYMIGSFTILTFLMKNSLLDVLKLDYVRTARAKGLSENTVIYKHAVRNALIPIITGMSGFLAIFFSGSLVVELIFSLDGIGLLGYQSVLDRDYNVIMGLIFLQSVVLLIGRIITDVMYMIVDPRIDFN